MEDPEKLTAVEMVTKAYLDHDYSCWNQVPQITRDRAVSFMVAAMVELQEQLLEFTGQAEPDQAVGILVTRHQNERDKP